MGTLNKVFLMGNLTRDPELRYVPSGTAVCTFSMAINQKYKTQSGEMKEDVTFVNITVWAKAAENCGEYLKKGSSVLVEGCLKFSSWEAEDGKKRSKLDVTAQRVQFLWSKEKGASADKAEDAAPTPSEETPF